MPAEELPEWTTEMDREILEVLSRLRILTPAVIADNIGRSREAVSRRLNTLEAGGLVSKVERGKYTITIDGIWPLMEPIGAGEDWMEEAAEDDQEIQDEFGLTFEEFRDEIVDEFNRLREEREGYWSTGELFDEALLIVEERARKGS